MIDRRPNGTYLPGVSGNPRGRPATFDEMAGRCRQHPAEAVDTLLMLMRSPDTPPATRVLAANSVLDRGWGKPAQAFQVSRPVDLEDLSDAELLAIAVGADPLPIAAPRVVPLRAEIGLSLGEVDRLP